MIDWPIVESLYVSTCPSKFYCLIEHFEDIFLSGLSLALVGIVEIREIAIWQTPPLQSDQDVLVSGGEEPMIRPFSGQDGARGRPCGGWVEDDDVLAIFILENDAILVPLGLIITKGIDDPLAFVSGKLFAPSLGKKITCPDENV